MRRQALLPSLCVALAMLVPGCVVTEDSIRASGIDGALPGADATDLADGVAETPRGRVLEHPTPLRTTEAAPTSPPDLPASPSTTTGRPPPGNSTTAGTSANGNSTLTHGSTGAGNATAPGSPAPTTSSGPQSDPATMAELARLAEAAAAPIDKAANAMGAGDWVGALGHAQQARTAMRAFNARFRVVEFQLAEHDRGIYDRFSGLYAPLAQSWESMASWNLLVERNADAYTKAPAGSPAAGAALRALRGAALPAERAEASLRQVADQLDLVSADVQTVLALGFRDGDVQRLRNLAAEVRASDESLQAEVTRLLQEGRFGSALAMVEAASGVPASGISAGLAAFMDSFDADGSGNLSRDEGAAFYSWVEANIRYRYDDEGVTDPYPGLLVGDSRRGNQYTQTPDETWAEGAGDCEDMNRLEVAFYNHFGVAAYQAFVNANGEEVDHAIAIVRVAATTAEAEAIMGRIDSYSFAPGNAWGIPAGVYAIVDNAYSNDYGLVSGGIPPDRFTIHQVLDVNQTFEAIGLPVE